jgi:type IV pilus assembly protein PilV
MIEVLVALLILLIGLLGVVRMQLLSVQNNQGAYLRTQATYIASDMLDRMRANRAGRNEDAGGSFVDHYVGFELSALEDTASDAPADPACAGTTDGCNAEQLADMDLREISSHFVDVYGIGDGWVPTLPEGSITIDKTASGDNDEYVVTVGWLEQGWDTDADGEAIRAGSIQRSVQLRSMIRRVALFGGGSPPDPNDPS